MICAYLGPLAAGLSKGIVYASSDTNQIPNWTEHLFLLGGLTSSVFVLSLLLRVVGRVRTSASVTILLLVLTIVQMFISGDIDKNNMSGTSILPQYLVDNWIINIKSLQDIVRN